MKTPLNEKVTYNLYLAMTLSIFALECTKQWAAKVVSLTLKRKKLLYMKRSRV